MKTYEVVGGGGGLRLRSLFLFVSLAGSSSSSSDHGLMKLCFYPFTFSSRKKLLPVRLPTPGLVGHVRLGERGERESVPKDRLCV